MKSSELMIGNYIFDDFYEVHRVECIKSDMFVSIDTMGSEQVVFSKINNGSGLFVCDSVRPIPLTEEWLLEFGFVEIYSSDFRKTFELPLAPFFGYSFKYRQNKKGDAIYYGRYLKCEYVHQLQNLYLALTGKELEGSV